jgi:Uma2 family endonuclease
VKEILFTSTGYYDIKKKFQGYERYGVQEYFIVEPGDIKVVGYWSNGGRFQKFLREKRKISVRSVERRNTICLAVRPPYE